MGHPKGDKNSNGKLDAGDLILQFLGRRRRRRATATSTTSPAGTSSRTTTTRTTTRATATAPARRDDSTAAGQQRHRRRRRLPALPLHPAARRRQLHRRRERLRARPSSTRPTTTRSVVQCALGTINTNRVHPVGARLRVRQGRRSSSPAWPTRTRATTTCPRRANHTLPVHAISYDAPSLAERDARSSAYHPCSNYGGQNSRSSVGHAAARARRRASSRASPACSTRRRSSTTSARRSSPAEAQSIFFTDGRRHRRPRVAGAGRRTTSGRSRASISASATAASTPPRRSRRSATGRSRPRSTSTSPTWFSVLYKDQVERPGRDQGHRLGEARERPTTTWSSGRRACSRSTASSRPVAAEMKNIPPTMVIGSRRPAGDARHPHHRHRRTSATRQPARRERHGHHRARARRRPLRRPIGDVRGEMRRTLLRAERSHAREGLPDLPRRQRRGKPQDGRHRRRRRARARSTRPAAARSTSSRSTRARARSELPGLPLHDQRRRRPVEPRADQTTPVLPRARRPTRAAGVDADASPASRSSTRRPSPTSTATGSRRSSSRPTPGTIYVIGSDGKAKPGWPKRLPARALVPARIRRRPRSQPCMERRHAHRARRLRLAGARRHGQGRQARHHPGRVRRQHLRLPRRRHARSTAGRSRSTTPASSPSEPQRNRILTTPAVADFNGDGIPDCSSARTSSSAAAAQAGAHLPHRRPRHARRPAAPCCPTGRSRSPRSSSSRSSPRACPTPA